MRRIATTVIAVVGAVDDGAVEQLSAATNIALVRSAAPDAEPLDRAVDAWRQAARSRTRYTVHTADPLAAVSEAWVRTYDGAGARGELEVATSDTLQRWRAGGLDLPDYYVVVDADQLTETSRHWHLGVVHSWAPVRVIPSAAGAEAVLDAIGHLASGRWWPPLDEALEPIDRVVPDRVGITSL